MFLSHTILLGTLESTNSITTIASFAYIMGAAINQVFRSKLNHSSTSKEIVHFNGSSCTMSPAGSALILLSNRNFTSSSLASRIIANFFSPINLWFDIINTSWQSVWNVSSTNNRFTIFVVGWVHFQSIGLFIFVIGPVHGWVHLDS